MLTPVIDGESSLPLYEQLYRYIREEITTGRLAAYEKLPGKRTLAAHLRISQSTVETAYAQLTAEGYLIARPRSGYYVPPLEASLGPPAERDAPAAVSSPSPEADAPLFDFSTGEVDTTGFPFATWARLTREVLGEDSRELLRASPPQGDEALRREIARHLRAFRGIVASPEQILVGAGSEYLLGLAVQLLGRDASYAVENPGYPKIRRILQANGAPVEPVGMDRDGLRLDALQSSGARAVHITPSHHFPLGGVTPVSRRLRLLRWAEERPDRYILEDDYDSEFRFAGRPIPALQGLDRGGRVLYFNTFAKSLAPSLRIGYLVLPPALLERYRRELNFYASTVPRFEQQVLRRFLQDGHFERHLNRMRLRYKARRDALLAALERHDPLHRIAVSGQDTGLHLLLQVEDGWREDELVASAREQGVRVYGLSGYYGAPEQCAVKSAVVLGYAGVPPERMEEAVSRLSRAWNLERRAKISGMEKGDLP